MSNFKNSLKTYQVNMPIHIVRDKRMNARTKGVLLILASHNDDWKFYVSQVADDCRLSKPTLQRELKILEELGYLKRTLLRDEKGMITGNDWELLDPLTPDYFNQPIANNNVDSNEYDESDSQLELIPELATEAVAGTESKTKAKEEQLKEDFEKLWELYPNKKGKAAAFKAYKKAIKDGVTNKEIQTGIVAYKKQIAINHTEKQYIKHGSTFFNQRCWEDEDLKMSTKTTEEPKQQETTKKVSEVTPELEAALFKNYYN